MSTASPESGVPPTREPEAVYLFALVADDDFDIDHVGVSGEPVEILHCGHGLRAVVDRVSRNAWEGEGGAKNLQSLAWVAPRATRHEEVVEATTAQSPAFPASFATLFSSPDRLRAMVESQSDVIHTYLRRVKGAREWAVKLILDRQKAVDQLKRSKEPAASGTAYLQKRKRERDIETQVDARVAETAETAIDALLPHAVDTAVRRPKNRPDDPRDVCTHWAFLVQDENVAAFRDALHDLQEQCPVEGLDIECTGPWPSYSFRPSLTPDSPDFS